MALDNIRQPQANRKNLEALESKENQEHPLSQRSVDEDTEQLHTLRVVENEVGGETVIRSTHKPGTPRETLEERENENSKRVKAIYESQQAQQLECYRVGLEGQAPAPKSSQPRKRGKKNV